MLLTIIILKYVIKQMVVFNHPKIIDKFHRKMRKNANPRPIGNELKKKETQS